MLELFRITFMTFHESRVSLYFHTYIMNLKNVLIYVSKK